MKSPQASFPSILSPFPLFVPTGSVTSMTAECATRVKSWPHNQIFLFFSIPSSSILPIGYLHHNQLIPAFHRQTSKKDPFSLPYLEVNDG
jgi:hypothetical protein